jgi:hypothetical protein
MVPVLSATSVPCGTPARMRRVPVGERRMASSRKPRLVGAIHSPRCSCTSSVAIASGVEVSRTSAKNRSRAACFCGCGTESIQACTRSGVHVTGGGASVMPL